MKKIPLPAHKKRVLDALMQFRLIINMAKRHFKWVEAQCGISGVQLWILSELHDRPGLSVTELAKSMALHQSTVSNLVDKLLKSTLITRRRDANDKRVATLWLTASGKHLIERAPRPARGLLPEALYQLHETELASLQKLLGRILDQMHPIDKKAMKKPLAELLLGK